MNIHIYIDQTAIIWDGDEIGQTRKVTYAELAREVSKIANTMKTRGVKKGIYIYIYVYILIYIHMYIYMYIYMYMHTYQLQSIWTVVLYIYIYSPRLQIP
jgi:acyl-coenzyme A synthetase/AMP-(fatty) acid ligase